MSHKKMHQRASQEKAIKQHRFHRQLEEKDGHRRQTDNYQANLEQSRHNYFELITQESLDKQLLRKYEDNYLEGREIMNSVPRPTRLFTLISPLWEETIALAIARPRPEPKVFPDDDPR